MRTDPDHTTDGPDIDGLFDALDAIDALRAPLISTRRTDDRRFLLRP